LLQQATDKSLPAPFTMGEITAALQRRKPATASGYNKIHSEFLKHLDPELSSGCHPSTPASWLHALSQRFGERPKSFILGLVAGSDRCRHQKSMEIKLEVGSGDQLFPSG